MGTVEKKIKTIENSFFVVMLLLFFAAIFLSIVYADVTDPAVAVNVFVVLIGMLFALILFLCCLFDRFHTELRQKSFFELLIVDVYIALFLFGLTSVMRDRFSTNTNHIMNYAIYLVTAGYWLVFRLYQKDKYPDRKHDRLYFYIFNAINIDFVLVVLLNLFYPLVFVIDESGEVIWRAFHVDILSTLYLIVYTVYIFTSKSDRKTKLLLISYLFFPAIVHLLLFFFWNRPFLRSVASSMYSIAYLIPLYLVFFNVYIEYDRALLQQKTELMESRVNALALQINPHFISNTLGSIASLCVTAPEEAEKLTIRFARYLRSNYVEPGSDAMIPFTQEIEQLKNYLSIEQVRFPRLKAEYDIRFSDFLIPSLTVQPLVENAVHHGIQKRRGSEGTVVISSREEGDRIVITIADNGVGFKELSGDRDQKKHLGIRNAASRLAILCDGTLTVESTPGKGTVSVIEIPKERKKKK